MSGNEIAYHLRPNKAIDRNLFIALLERVGRVRNISDYEYIGFGGPMLEDYKALHAALRIKRMHSIEQNLQTYKRQQFNRPASFVKLHYEHSTDFFRKHEFSDRGTVVWLDYTEAKHKEQLDELVDVASKLATYDVIKITLNAKVANLGAFDGKPAEEKSRLRMAEFVRRLDDHAIEEIHPSDMETGSFPSTLQRCVKQALGRLPAGEGGRYFQILSSFVYSDGQPMLTVTGIILEMPVVRAAAAFRRASRLGHWPFVNLNWSPPVKIDVPALTAKERMRLDEVLPLMRGAQADWQKRLERHLGFKPSGGDSLAHYARFYRAYPHFSRIVL